MKKVSDYLNVGADGYARISISINPANVEVAKALDDLKRIFYQKYVSEIFCDAIVFYAEAQAADE